LGQENVKIAGDPEDSEPVFGGDVSMRKPRALTLCCCFAALPLLGCANGASSGAQPQAESVPGPAPAYAMPADYYTGGSGGAQAAGANSDAPAAILVVMPGPGDFWAADPGLWTAQGFDVVVPPPSDLYRLAADPQAVFDRLIAEARAMANAPIWLVGPNPAIEAAMAGAPPSGPSQVSGVVMTSATSGTGICSETMTYTSSGNGAAPQVKVSKSGNACPPGSPFGVETNQGVVPQGQGAAPVSPAVQPPYAPRLIEAAAPAGASPASRQAAIQRVAELIKSAPPS
jgi:hypothetical protein